MSDELLDRIASAEHRDEERAPERKKEMIENLEDIRRDLRERIAYQSGNGPKPASAQSQHPQSATRGGQSLAQPKDRARVLAVMRWLGFRFLTHRKQ